MITLIVFAGISLLLLFAVIAIGVWFFSRFQQRPQLPPVHDDLGNPIDGPKIEPTANPAPAAKTNNSQQEITWGQWHQDGGWKDEELTRMGLGRCAQLRKLNPEKDHIISAAIIIKAYGLTTPYGKELDETAIDYAVHPNNTITFSIGLNAQENWEKIQDAHRLEELTVKPPLNASNAVYFTNLEPEELDENGSTETKQNATITWQTFQAKTMALFMGKLSDNPIPNVLHSNQNTGYPSLWDKTSALSRLLLPPHLNLTLTRLREDQTENPIVPSLAINQLLGFLVYYKSQALEPEKIQEFLNIYHISAADEPFLHNLYKRWDRQDKFRFIQENFSPPLPQKIIDAIRFDPDPRKIFVPDPKEILGHLLFLAHNKNEISADAVHNCVLIFNQTFNAKLSASQLYQDHVDTYSATAGRSDFLVRSIIQKFKDEYFTDVSPNKTTVLDRFIDQLKATLSTSLENLNWGKMKHLDGPTIFEIMVKQSDLSHALNFSPYPMTAKMSVLERILRLFEWYKTQWGKRKTAEEFTQKLNTLASNLHDGLRVGFEKRELEISNALETLDAQLAQQQIEPEKIVKTTPTATTPIPKMN